MLKPNLDNMRSMTLNDFTIEDLKNILTEEEVNKLEFALKYGSYAAQDLVDFIADRGDNAFLNDFLRFVFQKTVVFNDITRLQADVKEFYVFVQETERMAA